MCSPARWRSCGKVTWSGCGMHADSVLASVPKQGKTGKQGQSAGTSLSGKAKEPRPPRPAPLPPVFVDGKLLPSPEYGPLGYRQPMPKERSPPNMMGSKAIP